MNHGANVQRPTPNAQRRRDLFHELPGAEGNRAIGRQGAAECYRHVHRLLPAHPHRRRFNRARPGAGRFVPAAAARLQQAGTGWLLRGEVAHLQRVPVFPHGDGQERRQTRPGTCGEGRGNYPCLSIVRHRKRRQALGVSLRQWQGVEHDVPGV